MSEITDQCVFQPLHYRQLAFSWLVELSSWHDAIIYMTKYCAVSITTHRPDPSFRQVGLSVNFDPGTLKLFICTLPYFLNVL